MPFSIGKKTSDELVLTPKVLKELDHKSASYAILSHRWGAEVNYDEMTGLMKMDEGERDEVRHRAGYKKIIKSCEQAMRDGHRLLWVDTCCIDKQSSAELSEAINSMYQWYQDAQVCYAYLHDVDESAFPAGPLYSKFSTSNGWPEWFLRGWTLQELIAPKEVQFFNKDWVCIGDKWSLAPRLESITQVPCSVLRGGLVSASPSVAQIMSWAAGRRTTRVEDRAYSLLGLFGVSMPMLYGEGEKAFRRLQLEIIRESNDYSIFAWSPSARAPRYGSVLADDPSYFGACHNIQKVEADTFVDYLIMYIDKHELGKLGNESKLREAAQQLSVFVATNAGIQICLPVIPYCHSTQHVFDPIPYTFESTPPIFRAILACSDHYGNLITVDLCSRGSSFDRTFTDKGCEVTKTSPEFKALYLTHHQVANPWYRGPALVSTLDDTSASYHGFTRCESFPRETTGNVVTLSSGTDLIVIVYVNYSATSRFAIGLGNHFGKQWVHVICDECLANQQDDCKPCSSFAERAYDAMWSARKRHARGMPESRSDNVKHVHLPQSIWAATVIWRRLDTYKFTVMIDIKQCPGCCVGPHEWTVGSFIRIYIWVHQIHATADQQYRSTGCGYNQLAGFAGRDGLHEEKSTI
ncbi:heterokaryon incompatibility protein-domain-containing protein [Pisolithus marmoratus]|nr:heterokaryon incompatibility protein-domain-containing protein [Pisolithus marmoratus]